MPYIYSPNQPHSYSFTMLWILCSLAHLVMYGVKASECIEPLVEDICVYGNDKSFITEGAPFKFFTYNSITKTNVYFCEECGGSKVPAYLYGCIEYGSQGASNYYWKISDDYQSCLAWSSCYVGDESLGPNYTFDINDCLYNKLGTNNWHTYDGSVDVWNDDDDMSLSRCNAICYECDVYPEINTTISKSIESEVTASTAWNGDVYFDFSIYDEDCIDPRLSFDYEVIDHDETYENIEIYDNIGMIIATCNGSQNCGTFSSCVSDYYLLFDDMIQMGKTYSFSIHQTVDVDNLCGDYILNAVLTLTCGPNNTDNIIASTCSSNNSHNIITPIVSSTVSSTSSSTVSSTSSSTVSATVYSSSSTSSSSTSSSTSSVVISVLCVILFIIGIAIYCYCKCCNCIHRILNETVKEVNEYTAVQKGEKRVVGLVLVEM